MESIGSYSDQELDASGSGVSTGSSLFSRDRISLAIYLLALAASISIWFLAANAPLRLDELGTYWQIKEGFSEIWPRHFVTLSSPEFGYILWLSTKIFGSSEIALRIPSILAMLASVYVLYLAARELFGRDVAIIAAVAFCLNPIVVFESIDARPYAFAALLVNLAILILIRLRHNSSNWMAVLFGLTAACIVWLQFLFVDILPALVLCFFASKVCDRKTLWRQFGIALAALVVASLPVLPIMFYLLRTSNTHVYESAPRLSDLVTTIAPGWYSVIFCVTGLADFLLSSAIKQHHHFSRSEGLKLLLCASLALMPILILFGVSTGSSMHIFATCHRIDAIPGIALCWAFALSRFRSDKLRLVFCIALVTLTVVAYQPLNARSPKVHGYTWKYALEYAEENTGTDHAPVVICSDFPEADYAPMPLNSAKDNKLFAQLSYYKLTAPVIPLPRALNDEAVRVGSLFLHETAQKHERFLALANEPSYKTLDWLTQNASATHSVHKVGIFDGVEVLEFVPRSSLTPRSDR